MSEINLLDYARPRSNDPLHQEIHEAMMLEYFDKVLGKMSRRERRKMERDMAKQKLSRPKIQKIKN